MQTVIGVNDPKAVKRYSATLFVDSARQGYFGSKFSGKGENAQAPINVMLDLSKDAGDTITYDLSLQLNNQPVFGDDVLKGKEGKLKFATDQIKIDQVRCGVNAGGRMTRKRVLHDLREVARARMGEWWGRFDDEDTVMYASGGRAHNDDYILPLGFTGYAGNAFVAPDSQHLMYSGAATSKASMTDADILTLTTIEKLVTKAKTMGGGATNVPRILPMRIEGRECFVLLMSPFDEYNVRNNANVGQWIDIQKAAAGAQGAAGPLFKGAMGMHNGVILHSHQIVSRFTDYGTGDVHASRSLFMGRQAIVRAYGTPGNGLRMDWHEETDDRGNQLVITSSAIRGTKKCRFEQQEIGAAYDFGLIAVDSAAKDPNATA